MTVNVIDGQLKVTLTEAETVRYNIDKVFFDKASEPASKALMYLLKTAAAKVSFNSTATRFVIELYPVFSGGCEVWYIPDSTASDYLKCSARPSVKRRSMFEFDSSDSMLSACEALYLDDKTRYLKSSLYELNGRYRLSVTGLKADAFKKVCFGFADRILTKALDRAKTAEHWHCICPKNAVAVLGAALCRDISQD